MRPLVLLLAALAGTPGGATAQDEPDFTLEIPVQATALTMDWVAVRCSVEASSGAGTMRVSGPLPVDAQGNVDSVARIELRMSSAMPSFLTSGPWTYSCRIQGDSGTLLTEADVAEGSTPVLEVTGIIH